MGLIQQGILLQQRSLERRLQRQLRAMKRAELLQPPSITLSGDKVTRLRGRQPYLYYQQVRIQSARLASQSDRISQMWIKTSFGWYNVSPQPKD